jgi:26S proteasome regulatory subunit N12
VFNNVQCSCRCNTGDVFESAVLLSVKSEDIAAFDRHIAQAKIYYNDYWLAVAGVATTRSGADDLKRSAGMAPSDRQPIILGLNMMRLLAQNQIAEFHAELELLAPQFVASNYVQFVLGLERYANSTGVVV